MKMIDMEKDFKAYEPFDIGAMGEFDVDILIEQYAGQKTAAALYPSWRGGYYFAGRPKQDKSAPISVLYVSRWSTPAALHSLPPFMRNHWPSAIKSIRLSPTTERWPMMRRRRIPGGPCVVVMPG